MSHHCHLLFAFASPSGLPAQTGYVDHSVHVRNVPLNPPLFNRLLSTAFTRASPNLLEILTPLRLLACRPITQHCKSSVPDSTAALYSVRARACRLRYRCTQPPALLFASPPDSPPWIRGHTPQSAAAAGKKKLKSPKAMTNRVHACAAVRRHINALPHHPCA
jgi:hypothetical protein